MEITTMQMYWLVMLDNIIGVLSAILAICILFFIFGIFIFYEIKIEKEERYFSSSQFFSFTKKLLFVVAALILLLTFIPSTKKMAAIIVVPKIANSEKVQTIGNNIYDLAVEWMKELKPTKKAR